jgi:hypothetical protein
LFDIDRLAADLVFLGGESDPVVGKRIGNLWRQLRLSLAPSLAAVLFQASRLAIDRSTLPLLLPNFLINITPVFYVCSFPLVCYDLFELLSKFVFRDSRLLHPAMLVHLLHADPLPGIRAQHLLQHILQISVQLSDLTFTEVHFPEKVMLSSRYKVESFVC